MDSIKKKLILILIGSSFFTPSIISAQDTVQGPFKPDRPHEIGISILTPIMILTGSSPVNDKMSNLTYRYRMSDRKAFRLFAGLAPSRTTYPDPVAAGIIQRTDTAYYDVVLTTKPANWQVGFGFEYMFGGRLKHVPSIDLVYHNIFQKDEYFTMQTVKNNNQGGQITYNKLDSTSYIRAYNEDRYGVNLGYSLRYPLSRRWVLTGTLIISYRYQQRRLPNGNQVTNQSFEMNGPLSDVSLFYRF